MLFVVVIRRYHHQSCPTRLLVKWGVAVEKLLRARISRNQIAPGCPINDLLEFRDISGHPISTESGVKKSFSTGTGFINSYCSSRCSNVLQSERAQQVSERLPSGCEALEAIRDQRFENGK